MDATNPESDSYEHDKKMSLDGWCNRLMKYILVAFNTLVLILGATAVGLGTWSLTTEYGEKEMKVMTGSELYHVTCTVVIVAGSVVCVIALAGCLGGLLESRPILGVYLFIMLVILILFLICAIIGFFFRESLEEELSAHMKLTLTEQFYVNYSRDDTNTLATDLWNKIQREFHCCGVSGGLKSSWSWWLYQKSKWFEQQKGPDEFKNFVPESCCDMTLANLTECQRLQDSGGPVFMPAQRQPSMVTDPNPALYHQGCYDAVRESITENSAVIAAVILVTILITVICIALAACVCMEIRYDNYVV